MLGVDGTPEHDPPSSAIIADAAVSSTCGAFVETERDGGGDGRSDGSDGGGVGAHSEGGVDTADTTTPVPSTAGAERCLGYVPHREGGV